MRPSGWDSLIETDEGLRQVLLRFIERFADWDVAGWDDYVKASRELVNAAHPEGSPLVVDPSPAEAPSHWRHYGWGAKPSPVT